MNFLEEIQAATHAHTASKPLKPRYWFRTHFLLEGQASETARVSQGKGKMSVKSDLNQIGKANFGEIHGARKTLFVLSIGFMTASVCYSQLCKWQNDQNVSIVPNAPLMGQLQLAACFYMKILQQKLNLFPSSLFKSCHFVSERLNQKLGSLAQMPKIGWQLAALQGRPTKTQSSTGRSGATTSHV